MIGPQDKEQIDRVLFQGGEGYGGKIGWGRLNSFISARVLQDDSVIDYWIFWAYIDILKGKRKANFKDSFPTFDVLTINAMIRMKPLESLLK